MCMKSSTQNGTFVGLAIGLGLTMVAIVMEWVGANNGNMLAYSGMVADGAAAALFMTAMATWMTGTRDVACYRMLCAGVLWISGALADVAAYSRYHYLPAKVSLYGLILSALLQAVYEIDGTVVRTMTTDEDLPSGRELDG